MATDRRKYKTEWQRKKRREIRRERAANGDPVRMGRPKNAEPFIKQGRRLDAICISGLRALKSLHFADKDAVSWRLFKWHTIQAFVGNSTRQEPTDAELITAFKMLLEGGYVLPASYSRRGFPLEVSRSVEGESF